MDLHKDGITIQVINPTDIAHFKRLGYVEVEKPKAETEGLKAEEVEEPKQEKKSTGKAVKHDTK